jgi:polysaccharide export outer membrane protein
MTLGTAVLVSCASYKQNIMFQVSDNTKVSEYVKEAEKNYTIQKNDFLKLEVYTQGGERIIDPELKLMKDMPVQNNNLQPDPSYLVNVQGIVKLPMIGEIKLEGLTIRKAEQLLQEEYKKFYKEPYVILEFTNKRVIVLGGQKIGAVVPLSNENMSLVEVIALAEGVDNFSMAHNIRIMRGDDVFVTDLSTIEGYQKGNMTMENGDVVYIEPVRRPVSEAARDYAPLFSLAISITTLIVVLLQL